MSNTVKPVFAFSFFYRYKRVISLVVCFLMLISGFTSMPTKAEAIGPEIVWATEGALEVIAWLFALFGVQFASHGEMVLSSNQFLNDNPAIEAQLGIIYDSSISNQASNKLLQLSKEAYSYIVTTVIPAIKSYLNYGEPLKVYDDYKFIYNDSVKYVNREFIDAEDAFASARYDMTDVLVFSLPSGSYEYKMYSGTTSGHPYYSIELNGEPCTHVTSKFAYQYMVQFISSYDSELFFFNENYISNSLVFKYGFYKSTVSGYENYLYPYIALRYIKLDGQTGYKYYRPSNRFVYGGVPYLAGLTSSEYIEVPFQKVIDYDYSDFYTALRKKLQEWADGISLDIPWDIPGQDVEEGKEEAEKTDEEEKEKAVPFVPDWAQVWESLGISDLVKTLSMPDPDLPYKPSVTTIPTIGNTWNYVSSFAAKALIWMQLWFSGFVLLPAALKSTLWALLVITIVTGLLGVFLK